MKYKISNIKYGIKAYSSSGHAVFYVQNSNGEHMTPNAISLAVLYDSKKQAAARIPHLQNKFSGLSFFTVFQNI